MKYDLQLDNVYVLEQCVYVTGDSMVYKLRVFRYTDDQPQMCLLDCDPGVKVSIVTTIHDQSLLNRPPRFLAYLMIELS